MLAATSPKRGPLPGDKMTFRALVSALPRTADQYQRCQLGPVLTRSGSSTRPVRTSAFVPPRRSLEGPNLLERLAQMLARPLSRT